MLDFESAVTSLMAQCNWDRATAEARVRSQLAGQVDVPAPVTVDRTGELEKAIELRGDRLMQAHGFTVIRFSQARASRLTPGIPDRRYYRPPRPDEHYADWFRRRLSAPPGYALWWEAKTETGEQSPAQRAFQQLVEPCGETYLLGTDAVLRAWLEQHGLFCP